ncbi:unnamed protein product [Prorocentrum cordatum]|uniref:RanBP2-type domain-containing protein n=1 Tax=Prorocentrum cordatum TaxID=2364126 RepID=A0ABN9TLQ1_9DINO|nr:unnamed protein product [Polarella glacialis]
MQPRRRFRPVARSVAAAAAAAAALAVLAGAPGAPGLGFVSGGRPELAPTRGGSPTGGEGVALRATGMQPTYVPNPTHKETKRNRKVKVMARMPCQWFSTAEIMRRIVTVLIHNNEEKFRDAPMRTKDLMKEIGLTGYQMKIKRYVNEALYLLLGQKVIFKAKTSPIRWELHEEYRKDGLPPISKNKRKPWALSWLLQFERTKKPKYGPVHGEYRNRPWVPFAKRGEQWECQNCGFIEQGKLPTCTKCRIGQTPHITQEMIETMEI